MVRSLFKKKGTILSRRPELPRLVVPPSPQSRAGQLPDPSCPGQLTRPATGLQPTETSISLPTLLHQRDGASPRSIGQHLTCPGGEPSSGTAFLSYHERTSATHEGGPAGWTRSSANVREQEMEESSLPGKHIVLKR